MKGIKKLNKAIEKSINTKFDLDLKCNFSNEFAIYLDEDKINYTLINVDITERTFTNFLKKHGATIENDMDGFVYSFLHEIGHYYTYDEMTPIIKKLSRLGERLISILNQILPQNDFIYSLYYYLPHEKIASQWAIQTDPELREEMKKEIGTALNNFYKANFS